MSLLVSEKTNYTPAPAGLHNAVCVSIIDLGLQQTTYGQKPQVLFVWELSDALMDDGRPFTLSRRFSPSLSKKATLRTILEAWLGRAFTREELAGFALKKFLGKPCQLLVQHTPSADGSRTYANVTTVVPVNGGVTVTPHAELLYFDMDNPDQAVREKLPEWIRKLIDAATPPQPAVPPPAKEDFNDALNF